MLGGEITQAELVRELDVSSSVVRKWKRLFEHGSEVAVAADGDVVAAMHGNLTYQVRTRRSCPVEARVARKFHVL